MNKNRISKPLFLKIRFLQFFLRKIISSYRQYYCNNFKWFLTIFPKKVFNERIILLAASLRPQWREFLMIQILAISSTWEKQFTGYLFWCKEIIYRNFVPQIHVSTKNCLSEFSEFLHCVVMMMFVVDIERKPPLTFTIERPNPEKCQLLGPFLLTNSRQEEQHFTNMTKALYYHWFSLTIDLQVFILIAYSIAFHSMDIFTDVHENHQSIKHKKDQSRHSESLRLN